MKESSQFEKLDEQIIPGYASVFDKINATDEEGRRSARERFARANEMVSQAWTVSDLYLAAKEAIDLPVSEDERAIKLVLLDISTALSKIPVSDRRSEVEAANVFIEYAIIPRLNTILGGPQPQI